MVQHVRPCYGPFAAVCLADRISGYAVAQSQLQSSRSDAFPCARDSSQCHPSSSSCGLFATRRNHPAGSQPATRRLCYVRVTIGFGQTLRWFQDRKKSLYALEDLRQYLSLGNEAIQYFLIYLSLIVSSPIVTVFRQYWNAGIRAAIPHTHTQLRSITAES